jgi:hypothetical protein
MKIVSTSDVPLDELRRFAAGLGPDFESEVDPSQISLRSVDPPSWVNLLADSGWWTALLGASAALYVAELIKEAAKETWRNRGKAIVAAKASGNRLRELAVAIAAWRSQRSALTTLGIGFPVPSEFFSTKLALEGSDPDELAVQLALFIHHLPAVAQLIAEQGLADGSAATGVFLQLREDGALLVSWHDRYTLQVHERTLELRMSNRKDR